MSFFLNIHLDLIDKNKVSSILKSFLINFLNFSLRVSKILNSRFCFLRDKDWSLEVTILVFKFKD